MSDAEIRLLFEELERLSTVVAEAVTAVETATKKVELVHSGYHEHGGAIEHLRQTVDKLRLRCPLLGSREYPVVCTGKEDGSCPGGDS